mgnify:FL=1
MYHAVASSVSSSSLDSNKLISSGVSFSSMFSPLSVILTVCIPISFTVHFFHLSSFSGGFLALRRSFILIIGHLESCLQ